MNSSQWTKSTRAQMFTLSYLTAELPHAAKCFFDYHSIFVL
jgi:hypothetical protein